MTAIVLLTNQAPALSTWPVPTIAARSGTWATYVPRLFFNATFLARLRANWTNPYFVRLANRASAATDPLSQALTYLATGSTTNVTTAYTNALAQAYNLAPSFGLGYFGDYSSYVLDWCWPALTAPQRAALAGQLETNTNNRKGTLNGSTGFQLHEAHLKGYHAFLLSGLSCQGEAGTTDHRADLTHAVQNYQWWLAERGNGFLEDYNYQCYLWQMVELVWELATGQSIATLSGNPSWMSGRCEQQIRNMQPDLKHAYTTGMGDQEKRDSGGIETYCDNSFTMAVAAGYKSDPVIAWVANAASLSGTNWAVPGFGFETSYPYWTVLPYYDNGAPQTTPAAGWPLNRAYVTNFAAPGGGQTGGNWVSFRSGWTLTSGSTDIIAQFYGTFLGMHPEPGPGHLAIQRGMDELLTSANTYCGSPSLIQTNWSLWSFHNNCAVLSPTGSATPDKSGSAGTTGNGIRRAGSNTAFPAGQNLYWATGSQGAILANLTGFQESGGEHFATVDCSLGYQTSLDPLTYHRYVSFIPASKLFVVRDVYISSSLGRARFNWWGRAIPVASGSKAVVTRGSSQATIQCMDPAATLTIFGGVGSEQVIDGVSWPVTTANCQAGKPVANLAAAVAGQGRATFEVANTTTDVVHAITVDASGTTAPTYTLAQLKSLAPLLFGGPVMPGLTQLAQRATLDAEFSVTRYLALFTTQPSDDGTGGVEVSGTAYARLAMLSTDWGAASGGSPATKANTVAKAYAAAGSAWGTVVGWGFFDASTSGNLRWADYNGNFPWAPFTCTLASPGVLRSPGHGLTTSDQIAVTQKYGGTLPATGGSWAGLLTVTVLDADTFTAGVNTTGVGDGQFRKVVPQAILTTQVWTFQIGALVTTVG